MYNPCFWGILKCGGILSVADQTDKLWHADNSSDKTLPGSTQGCSSTKKSGLQKTIVEGDISQLLGVVITVVIAIHKPWLAALLVGYFGCSFLKDHWSWMRQWPQWNPKC